MDLIFVWLLIVGFVAANETSAQSRQDEIRNLGPQIRLTNISAGNVGWGVHGNPVLYTVIRGRPLQFNVVDVKTGDVLKNFTIEGLYDSTNGAVAVAPDGTVLYRHQREWAYVPVYAGGRGFEEPGTAHSESVCCISSCGRSKRDDLREYLSRRQFF